jgi:hypothetical protein
MNQAKNESHKSREIGKKMILPRDNRIVLSLKSVTKKKIIESFCH